MTLPLAREDHPDDRVLRIAFFDSSALIKRYSLEIGSQRVDEVFDRLPKSMIVCPVAVIAETVSILVRKKNDGRIRRHFFEQAILHLKRDFIEDSKEIWIPMDEVLVLDSLELIFQHHVNSTDALILHSALFVNARIREKQMRLLFLTSDRRLARAARAEALDVFDPEKDDSESLNRFFKSPEPDQR